MAGNSFRMLTGLAVGAGLMYYFDPDRGRRRRALIRDQLDSTVRRLENQVDMAVRDFSNRASGMLAECESALGSETPTDQVLAERVRAKMGRYVSHPGAIDVTTHDGRVILSGPILANEVDSFVSAVRHVRGVKDVENRFDVHEMAGDISALQGGVARRGEAREFMQDNWAPATRLAAGIGGGWLMLNCLARRTPTAVFMGTLGFGLFTRAVSNLPSRKLIGLGHERDVVRFQRTYHIGAPVDQVFDCITDHENFSRFMTNVSEVRNLGEGRLHWKICGPAGTEFEFDEQVTEAVPNERISWASLPGSPVAYEGSVRLEPEGDNSTKIHVSFCYNPPGGAAGHVVASLFGADPQTQMNQSFIRLKTFLETGKVPHDVEKRTSAATEGSS